MTFIKVFHNPTAGEGEHSEKKLVAKITDAGFDCSYSSTKDTITEKSIPEKTDFIVVAGGDGTVRKIAELLCAKSVLDKKFPIGLLPCGTANNIAFTLGIRGTTEEIIKSWTSHTVQPFDVGKITGLKESRFFLESLGFGIFPRLMKEMKARKVKPEDPEEDLREALETLIAIINDYKPKHCTVKIDDVEHVGKFLLVEIMNTLSIGPNLHISPLASTDDGEMEVILISEAQREALAVYVQDRMKNGKETPFFYTALKAKKVEVTWEGRMLHADDELIALEKSKTIKVEVLPGVLSFLKQPA